MKQKHMKRIFCLLLAILSTAALFSGCASSNVDLIPDSPEPTESASPSGDTDAAAFDYSAPLTEDGFFKDIHASELVTLPDYKGISIPVSVIEPDEADVQAQIDSILSQEAEDGEPIMDRAVEDGDTVNIDYVGSVDGVEFSGGSTEGQGADVTIGVTNYIDDFLEQLIGHKPGENFDIEVTFPDPYQNNPDLAGKDAIFNITINYIAGDPVLPELSDEIAVKYGADSVEALVKDIQDWLISNQKRTYFKTLMASASVSEVPASLLEYVQASDLAYYENFASAYGVAVEDIIKQLTGSESLDAYLEMQADFYRETAVFYLACQAIAEQEGLSVTQEDIDASGYANAVSTYGEPYVKMFVLQDFVCRDFVFDNAVIG